MIESLRPLAECTIVTNPNQACAAKASRRATRKRDQGAEPGEGGEVSAWGIRRPIGILLVEGGEEGARRKRGAANRLERSEGFRPTIGMQSLDDRVH